MKRFEEEGICMFESRDGDHDGWRLRRAMRIAAPPAWRPLIRRKKAWHTIFLGHAWVGDIYIQICYVVLELAHPSP
jgi:hypothetical protein